MLNGKLALHDVRDVEAFCARIAQRGKPACWADEEELLAYLVEEAWILSLNYESERGSFSNYATIWLGARLKDWERRSRGRTRWTFKDRIYERTLPVFVSYERETRPSGTHETTHTDEGERGELGHAVIRGQADPAEDRSPDLMRVLGEGGSAQLGDTDGLGEAPARAAA